MANFNRVILLGNLTRDPELRYLPSNAAVCEFGLAVNRRWRDKDGNQQDEVCFVDVSAWGRQGETIHQYMTKGRPILIEGRLKYDTWTAQDGVKRSKLSVVVENFTFVGDRGAGGGQERANGGGEQGGYGGYGGGSAPPPARGGYNRGADAGPPQRSAPAPAADYDSPPPTGDQIPF
ncbi:MAG: single-stranded DNA-binding protein [Phycisphaerales bacterium]|nr:single-stranded DNA-binding protein [Phycisphaerales bacterium]